MTSRPRRMLDVLRGAPARPVPALTRALTAAGVLLALGATMTSGGVAAGLILCGVALLLVAVFAPRPEGAMEEPPDVARRGLGEALGAPRADLQAVVAALPDPVIALDRDNRVLCFNAAAHTLAPALRKGELASVALRAPEVVEAVRSVAASAQAVEVYYAPRGSADRHFNIHVVPVGNTEPATGGRPAMILLVCHDLTPLMRVEQMRVDFIANASHELRTPLAALLGFIETLQGAARNDEAARDRFLPIMRAQATRMARLIDDLLSLSRIELSAHQRPTDPVAVEGVLRQVIDGLQMLAVERDVVIDLTINTDNTTVRGDRDELIRVFENLIENALKYGASGKRVGIVVAQSEAAGSGELTISVRDWGHGIAPEHLPRLTERFYRIDVRDSRAQGGTGLGLALVKHILNRHRGRLSIANAPGAGALFTVHLPLLAEASGAP